MKHLELFAGIGGFRRALDLIQQDLSIPMECVGFSEIDAKAKQTYFANFHIGENEVDMGDIVAFNSDIQNIHNLPNFDLLTGGFPCQTFSMMGKMAGFEEDRGQMFFRIMDIVNYCHPRYILLENVKNLMNHDRGNTIAVINKELEEAGYIVKMDVFNSNDFGLPQKRNRVIIFARRRHLGHFNFSAELVKTTFEQIKRNKSSLYFYNSTINLLEQIVDKKYYLSEKIKPTILSNGSAGFKSKSEIDQIVARPLTATMHKMHRACQDNYYSDLFIQSKGREKPSERMNKDELSKIAIRRLTPKEAFMLQGFSPNFATNAESAGVPDGAMYKQAGNAVSVNTIYAVIYYLITNNILL